MTLLKVALANTLNRLLDYLPPVDVPLPACLPGSRILVPFGSRQLTGVITSHGTSELDSKKLRHALKLIDTTPLFAERDMRFLLWAADYYLADPGEVCMQALPKDLRSGGMSKAHLSAWTLNTNALANHKPSKAQANACQILEELGGRAEAMVLSGFGIAANTLSSLHKIGIINKYNPKRKQTTPQDPNKAQGFTLTEQQQTAISKIPHQPDTFTVSLLEGVTGSGKTEVYIHLAADVLNQGRQVVILVPEIGLTPQTLGRFQQALGVNIVTLHSALGDSERTHSWQAVQTGQADLLIGTRSAILPPCPRLGLIIVDEEHDTSYKQQSGFRYNARDLAIIKGQHYACPVVLGSASPSLSSLHNVQARGFHHILLTRRATGASLPTVELLDMQQQDMMPSGLAEHSMFSIQDRIKSDSQVLVFVNRRGFAQSLFCYACGWQAMCQNCDARMTVHHAPPRLVCHHCQAYQKVPAECQHCSSRWLSAVGTGTEQITESLERECPGVPIIRIDQDSVRGKGQLQARLQQIRQLKPAILVGTQMLAKGHDFPHLSLVVVTGADNGLYSTDFRAIERTCQLLLQVSGRSGRHGKGKVIIQTTNPTSPYLQALQQHDYQTISRTLLKERHEAGMPPYNHMILIRAESGSESNVTTQLDQQADMLQQMAPKVEVFGPFEPSIHKLANKYRRQLLLIGNNRKQLNLLCQLWWQHYQKHQKNIGVHAIRWVIDVDPYDIF